jgi:hypothetical protein
MLAFLRRNPLRNISDWAMAVYIIFAGIGTLLLVAAVVASMALIAAALFVMFMITQLFGMKLAVRKHGVKTGYIQWWKFHSTR